MSDILKNQTEAVKFLRQCGLKISSSKFSQDYRNGVIPCNPDKTFHQQDILDYGKTLAAPEGNSNETDRKKITSLYIHLLHDILPHLELTRILDKKLEAWLQDASMFSDAKSLEAICRQVRQAREAYAEKLYTTSEQTQSEEKNLSYIKNETVETPNPIIKKTADLTNSYFRTYDKDLTKPLPCYDNPMQEFNFPGNTFCLTGEFALADRKTVEQEIISLGGHCIKAPVASGCILVVGTVASAQWIENRYGRKIEKAIEFRKNGYPVHIVSEDFFVEQMIKQDAN